MQFLFRQQLEKIITLTEEEFVYISAHFTEQAFSKHQRVIQEGASVRYDYYVLQGLLKAASISEEGKEHILQFAPEDWWITDAQAFHYGTPATLSVTSLEASRVLALTLDNKEKLCRELPKMEYFFLKKTTAGYIALQKRILELISHSAGQRYENLQTQYPGLLPRISKTMMASYLGVTRETLSRLQAS